MPLPLLRTKLYSPPLRPNLVERPRLIKRLQAGLHRKLTLISAPAGCGKTTLVGEWLASCACPAAWLSLDEKDNDPTRFLTYLIAALETICPQTGRSLRPLLDAPQPPPAERLMTELVNSLGGAPERSILVLDDYHTITALAVHQLLTLLLDGLPPTWHLVLTTRHDPPLPLPLLRARDQLTEIRQSDLRFSAAESASFFSNCMRLPLTPEEIAVLETRTEGWVAGLQLAALSLEGRDPAGRTQFIAGFSGRHHFVLDYLTDEVLTRQPETVQLFLLQTSILDQLSGPLCDAVTGGDKGRQILARLKAANLFIVPLDDERCWYRYHHLFAELLQARLQETRPGELTTLHRRAALWHQEFGTAADAIHHAQATGDATLAAEVIERATLKHSTWSRADVATLLRWLQSVPPDLMHHRPWLRLFAARALIVAGQWEQGAREMDELADWLRNHPTADDAALLLGRVMADQASLAVMLGHVHQTLEYAHGALEQVPHDDLIQRVRLHAILGMAHARAGDVRDAERAFEETVDLALQANMGYAAVPILCNLALTQFDQGRLEASVESCHRAIELGTIDGAVIAPAGFAGLILGKVHYERNELEAAEKQLRDGIQLLSRGGIAEAFGNLHAVLAQVLLARGDTAGALEIVQKAVLLAESSGIERLAVQAAAYQARIWLGCGELEAAARWSTSYQLLGPVEYLREFEVLTLARVLLVQSRPAAALELLDSLLPPAEYAGRQAAVIEIQGLRGLAWHAQGDLEQALAALGRALNLADTLHFARTLIDEGIPMAALLRQAALRGIAPNMVRRLLVAMEGTAAKSTPPASPLPEPLTGREQEVLQLLALELANAEIACRLVITLPTVKSHTRNLYGKLGVHTRRQAVDRARSLGLLPPL